MNQLESAYSLLSNLVQECQDLKSATDPLAQQQKIDKLIERCISSIAIFKPGDFKFLPQDVRIIFFGRLLKETSPLVEIADLIDAQTRRLFLTKGEYASLQPPLLKLMIKRHPPEKITVDTQGLSKVDIEKALLTLPQNDRNQITHLIIANSVELSDLNVLTYFPNLQILECPSCSKLKDLGGLKNCPKLQTLNLSQCLSLESLEGIENSRNLKLLNLENCRLLKSSGIVALHELANLDTLNLRNCLSILTYDHIRWSALQNLRVLDLGNNVYLPALESLASLRKLQTLLVAKENFRESPTYRLPSSVTIVYDN